VFIKSEEEKTAIRNLTEEALTGGGFYSPEGFPFSNM
jgi:hypothetical protein